MTPRNTFDDPQNYFSEDIFHQTTNTEKKNFWTNADYVWFGEYKFKQGNKIENFGTSNSLIWLHINT